VITYGQIPVDRVAQLATLSEDSPSREQVLEDLREAWHDAEPAEKAVLAAAGRALRLAEPRVDGLPLVEALSRIGVTALRPGQDRAIAAALAGLDTLVVMATGSGKSLCYQAPAAVRGGLSIVVSPLIALIEDQHAAMCDVGLPVAMLTSQMDERAQRETFGRITSGEPMLLYVAPERFNSDSFVNAVHARGVELFVVDEAHCVSEWGHDFRPDYRRVGEFRDRVGARATVALTATATPKVQRDIAARLRLREPIIVTTGFDRPNITYDALGLAGRGTVARKSAALRQALKECGDGAAIIYCGTRRASDDLADELRQEGYRTAAYHAGRSDRSVTQTAFMTGEVQVMCATNAFGMGVDKPDIRLVVHWAVPDSLEQYYQEAGRAGRDGEQSRALLLSASTDIGRIKNRISSARLGPEDVDGLLVRISASTDEDGAFTLPRRALDDRGRFELAMAERVGAVKAVPAPGGGTAGTLMATRLDAAAREDLEHQVGRELRRRWNALDALTRYADGTRCRRAAILDYFGDDREGSPEERCCDVCSPPSADFAKPAVPEVARRPAAPRDINEGMELADRELVDALRKWRLEVSRELGWPAFRVATNRVLKEIARARPHSRTSLREIPGVGSRLVEDHGDTILAIVADGAPQVSTRSESPAPRRRAPRDAVSVDQDAFERLREWRRERAEDRPAYTICTDKTLAEIVRRRPDGTAALSAISGIGPAFLERHSESLFNVLDEIAA